MPQASEEQRKSWGENGECGEKKAMDHLTTRGYKLTNHWNWLYSRKDVGEIIEDDFEAARFLIDEWDFGGIIDRLRINERTV